MLLQKIEEAFACAREIRRRGERAREIRERELFFTIVSGFNLLRLREYIYARYYVGSFFDDAGRRMRVERNQQRANDDERDVRERTKSV